MKSTQRRTFMVAVLCLSSLALAHCGAQPISTASLTDTASTQRPIKMSVFGDSIASGILADTQAGETLDSAEENRIFKALFALKDFSAGVDAGNLAFQKAVGAQEFSAFSGDFPGSHKRRLEARLGRPVVANNFAITGSKAATLANQITAAETLSRDSGPADFVEITIGSNDFCAQTKIDTFRETVRQQFERIRSLNPNAAILVMEIPDAATILTTPYGLAFTAFGTQVSCREIRDLEGICKERDLSPDSPPSVRKRAAQTLHDLNNILEQETLRIAGPDQDLAVFARPAELFGEIPQEMFGVDCYHPGRKGHETLAQWTWPFVESMNLGNIAQLP